MKIVSPPVSGSVAGICASRCRAGQFIRARRKPRHQSTTHQAAARARFSRAVAAFGDLDLVQRLAWVAAASNHLYTDSLGQRIRLTGQQLYVRCASNLSLIGAALPALPAADWSLPSLHPVVSRATVSSGIRVDFSPASSEDISTLWFLGPPVPSGRNSWDTYRFAGYVPYQYSFIAISSATYNSLWFPDVAGRRLNGILRRLSTVGVLGPAVHFSTLFT